MTTFSESYPTGPIPGRDAEKTYTVTLTHDDIGAIIQALIERTERMAHVDCCWCDESKALQLRLKGAIFNNE